MKKIIRLTESDLTRIVRRVIMEERECPCEDGTKSFECCPPKELNPITITANKDANGYKFFLVKPKDGVNFVRYQKSSGKFFENGKQDEVWARTQPNLSKEEVMSWFKRNNIKVKPNV
jgi:hypothetical protein